ncbi:hypothetical protein PR048_006842 [Dryococelus australis]|uniref:Uncharacterized protein n=1 Tax=Dryococelus australis TaxID=614101 RepID=A0ABQ9IC43_9NEOP|nr:hypothetical protein PR048_006842 [Dryococelus australis]
MGFRHLLENGVQLSPSTVSADNQCAVDIGIFVHKPVESSLHVNELANFSGRFTTENLIEVCDRRRDCTPVQCFARRGDESVGAHASVAPSTPTLCGKGDDVCDDLPLRVLEPHSGRKKTSEGERGGCATYRTGSHHTTAHTHTIHTLECLLPLSPGHTADNCSNVCQLSSAAPSVYCRRTSLIAPSPASHFPSLFSTSPLSPATPRGRKARKYEHRPDRGTHNYRYALTAPPSSPELILSSGLASCLCRSARATQCNNYDLTRSDPVYTIVYITHVWAVHDKVSTFEINIRKKALLLSAYVSTDGLSDISPVKLVTIDGNESLDTFIGPFAETSHIKSHIELPRHAPVSLAMSCPCADTSRSVEHLSTREPRKREVASAAVGRYEAKERSEATEGRKCAAKRQAHSLDDSLCLIVVGEVGAGKVVQQGGGGGVTCRLRRSPAVILCSVTTTNSRLHQHLPRSQLRTRIQFDLGSNVNVLHQRNFMILDLRFVDHGSKNRQFRRFGMDFIPISSPALNSNGATVVCVDLRSDLESSFEPRWCNWAQLLPEAVSDCWEETRGCYSLIGNVMLPGNASCGNGSRRVEDDSMMVRPEKVHLWALIGELHALSISVARYAACLARAAGIRDTGSRRLSYARQTMYRLYEGRNLLACCLPESCGVQSGECLLATLHLESLSPKSRDLVRSNHCNVFNISRYGHTYSLSRQANGICWSLIFHASLPRWWVSEEIGAAVNSEVLRVNGGVKQEIVEKTRRPAASSGTIPTCQSPGVARSGIEPGLPCWEASRLTAQPKRPLPRIGKFREFNDLQARLLNPVRTGDSAVCSLAAAPHLAVMGFVRCFLASLLLAQRHAGWVNSEPLTDLQGNKDRIPGHQVLGETGYTLGPQPINRELRL